MLESEVRVLVEQFIAEVERAFRAEMIRRMIAVHVEDRQPRRSATERPQPAERKHRSAAANGPARSLTIEERVIELVSHITDRVTSVTISESLGLTIEAARALVKQLVACGALSLSNDGGLPRIVRGPVALK